MAVIDRMLGRGEWAVVQASGPSFTFIVVKHLPQRDAATIHAGLSEAKARKLALAMNLLNSPAVRARQYDDFCARYPSNEQDTPND